MADLDPAGIPELDARLDAGAGGPSALGLPAPPAPAPASVPVSNPPAWSSSTSPGPPACPSELFTLNTGLLLPDAGASRRSSKPTLRHRRSRGSAPRSDRRTAGGPIRRLNSGSAIPRSAANSARSTPPARNSPTSTSGSPACASRPEYWPNVRRDSAASLAARSGQFPTSGSSIRSSTGAATRSRPYLEAHGLPHNVLHDLRATVRSVALAAPAHLSAATNAVAALNFREEGYAASTRAPIKD
jgi:hypothetical protein